MADARFAGTGRGQRDFVVDERIGTAGGVNSDCVSHVCCSSLS
jgi:hypothetical protein